MSFILERYEEEEKIWKTISFLWSFIFDHAVAETEERSEVESESGELDLKFKSLPQQLLKLPFFWVGLYSLTISLNLR